MRSLFLICLILLLSNCSATGLIDCEGSFVYSSDDFSLEEQAWIEQSSDRWNTWVGHTVVRVRPGERQVCSIVNGKTTNPNAVGEESEPTYVITIDKEHLQSINQLNQERFETVVMHEIGHALGYGHIKNGKALMDPYGANDFTQLDRIECIKHNMCKAISED